MPPISACVSRTVVGKSYPVRTVFKTGRCAAPCWAWGGRRCTSSCCSAPFARACPRCCRWTPPLCSRWWRRVKKGRRAAAVGMGNASVGSANAIWAGQGSRAGLTRAPLAPDRAIVPQRAHRQPGTAPATGCASPGAVPVERATRARTARASLARRAGRPRGAPTAPGMARSCHGSADAYVSRGGRASSARKIHARRTAPAEAPARRRACANVSRGSPAQRASGVAARARRATPSARSAARATSPLGCAAAPLASRGPTAAWHRAHRAHGGAPATRPAAAACSTPRAVFVQSARNS